VLDWVLELGNSLGRTFEAAVREGSALAYVFALVGGTVAAFTPCVLPIIPATVTVIGGQSEGKRSKAFVLSLLFALGIGLNYGIVGAIAGHAGASLGDLANDPWVKVGIAVVCILLAMAMFDRFHVPMPGFMQKLQSRQRMRAGYIGCLVSGFVFGFLAYACVAPIVGATALIVFEGGRVFQGAVIMFLFGLGLGIPFIVLGTFTGLITSLMARGGAMAKVKHGFGWLMLAVAGFFFFQAGQQHTKTQLAAMEDEPIPIVGPTEPGADTGINLSGIPTVVFDTSSSTATAEGDAAPNFTWTGADGRKRSFADLLDRPVLLSFWKDDCKNCPNEVPHLNELREQYDDRLWVIGVNHGDARAVARAWAKKHGVEYGIVLNRDKNLATKGFGATGVPHNVVIDTDGVIRSVATGGLPEDLYDTIRDLVE